MSTDNTARKLPDQLEPAHPGPPISDNGAVRTATFFFAANLLTGVFNYLFQVMASRSLTAAEFGQLNAWFADLAVLFFFGGLVQYYGIFFPARRETLRRAAVAINLLGLLLVGLWQLSPEGQNWQRGFLIFSGTTSLAWCIGQIHYRKLFGAIGTANLVNSFSKLLLVLLPLGMLSAAETFRFAYFICFLPALWVVSGFIWKISDEPAAVRQKRNDLQLWFAPAVLSLAAAVIPQMDMVLTSRLLPEVAFQDYARSSLFARGIYFVFLILAQWLLPFQIQGQTGRFDHRSITPLLAGLTVASAAVIGFVSPIVSQFLLGWEQAPPLAMVFLACLNMNLLTWLFLLVQKNCAEGHTRRAALALAGLAVEAAAQVLARWPAEGYFACAIAFQIGLIWFLSRKSIPKLSVQ